MTIDLPPETWGERLARARRRGKGRYGYSYRALAEQISLASPITDRALRMLEHRPTEPTGRRQRIIAVLYAFALGYAPEAFGLDDVDDLLRTYDCARLELLLDPDRWCGRRLSDRGRRVNLRIVEEDQAESIRSR